jgi:hypothetical protein
LNVPFACRTQPRCTPARLPFTTRSHSFANARLIMSVMRSPTVDGLLLVSVICWPTIGARSVSNAIMNCSIWSASVSVRSKRFARWK